MLSSVCLLELGANCQLACFSNGIYPAASKRLSNHLNNEIIDYIILCTNPHFIVSFRSSNLTQNETFLHLRLRPAVLVLWIC